MKFECTHTSFILAVEQVARARSKSSQTTSLQDIFLLLEEHQLTLRATNLELFCEKSIPVKGIHNGQATIKGDILVKVLQALKAKEGNLICELVEGVFVITSNKDVIEIKITGTEDFPTLPHIGKEIIELQQQELSTLIREVMFCAATTEIKPEIAAIFLYSQEEEIVSVATDSYRLAEKRIPKKAVRVGDLSVLIPQRYCGDIISILEGDEGEIFITQNETNITFTKGNLTVCSHIVSGQFPDYRQLFPKSTTTEVRVNKSDLLQALTTTSLFTENYTPLSYQINEGNLILQTKNEGIGSATKQIPIEHGGEAIFTHYNNRYFMDVLPHLTGDTVIMQFTVPTRPMVVTSNGDTSFSYLLMPVNR